MRGGLGAPLWGGLAPRVSRPGSREAEGPWLVFKGGSCAWREPTPGSPVHPQEFGPLTSLTPFPPL